MISSLLAALALGRDTVVGGAPVGDGRWDDAVVLLEQGVGFCTGTLIAPDVVLTAGHCLVDYDPDAVSLASKDWFDDGQGERIAIAETVVYPSSQATFDLGLIRLTAPSTVTPRVLALDCVAEQDLVDGATAWIVGFGATDEAGVVVQPLLNEAQTTIADADCSETHVAEGFLSGCRGEPVNPGGELGAGGGGVDACFGDSGGPLYLESPRGYFLAGVTSRSYTGVDGAFPCRSGGIWVRPDAVVDWIEETTGPLPRPACNLEPIVTAKPIVLQGGRGAARIAVADADSVFFRFDVIGTAHGRAEVDAAGVVTYRSDSSYVGSDEIIVLVADDGSLLWPEASAAVTRVVIPVRGPAGCEVGRAGWVLWFWVVPFVRRRGARWGR